MPRTRELRLTCLWCDSKSGRPASPGQAAQGSNDRAMLAPLRGKHANRVTTTPAPEPRTLDELTVNSATKLVEGGSHACPEAVQAWHAAPCRNSADGRDLSQEGPVSGGCSRKVWLPVAARPDHEVVGPPTAGVTANRASERQVKRMIAAAPPSMGRRCPVM
jgi:hypothetical protein